MSHLSFVEESTGKEEVATIDTHKRSPTITIPRHVVEDKSGGGDHLDVITIDVVDGDVKTRFFVDLHMNRQDRVTMHIATNVKEATNTKKLTGSWRPSPGRLKHSAKLS